MKAYLGCHARKQSENGHLLKAEETAWITLDNPAMRCTGGGEAQGGRLRAGLSGFTREPPANVEAESCRVNDGESNSGPEKARVVARTEKPVSGKATSGEPAPIKYPSDKAPESDKEPGGL